jgi:hypothetical protein
MPGRGQSSARPWTETERGRLGSLAETLDLTLDQILPLLGETCLDVHLNGATFWSSVPINVWDYTLGGYQVLKKWLSYCELSLLERHIASRRSRVLLPAQTIQHLDTTLKYIADAEGELE